MAKRISDLTNMSGSASIDRAADFLEVSDTSGSASYRATPNFILGITGNPVGTSDTQNIAAKTLDNTNTITLKDTLFTLQDDSDTTKQAKFQLSGISTSTTRTYTLPNASSTLVDLSTSQTLTSKTLTSPTINTATIVNPTLTTDTVSEYTSANGVTIDGLNIKDSKLNTNNSVVSTNIASFNTSVTAISNPYKFSAYRNAAWTAPASGGVTKIQFDAEDFDTNSNYDSVTNYRYVAPVAGFYFFSTSVSMGTIADGVDAFVGFYKNGSSIKNGTQNVQGGGASWKGNASTLLQLAASDYVEVHGYGNGNAGVTGSANTWFNGFLMSHT